MGNDPDPDPRDMPREHSSGSYALSGKIMLSAIMILVFVVILMVFLHLYARWYLLRVRRRHIRRRNRNRRTHLVFYVDPTAANPNPASVMRGLDPAVLKSLPVFTFFSESHPYPLECAVCLSEFEENESGRVLPKCNHSFHLDCIDMWFHSHSTCPLCRSPVEPSPVIENPVDVVINTSDTGSSSGLCTTCQHEDDQVGTSTSSFEARRKPMAIELTRRNNDRFEDESIGCDSPASQSFKSPISRILSLKRILSRDRRAIPSLSSQNLEAASCGESVSESDIERGREETQ